MRSTPGAARSTARPVFEKSAIVFVESTALTDTTPANEAGYIRIRVAVVARGGHHQDRPRRGRR